MAALLEVKGLTKRFGGLVAVDNVDFTVNAGEILAIIGPNGAGKTTVFNLISRVLDADQGDIRYEGRSVSGLKPFQMALLGVTRTFQNLQIFANLSVVENVLVGRHCRTRAGLFASAFNLPWTRREQQQAYAVAVAKLAEVGLGDLAHTPAGNLSLGQQRLVEIARAMALEPNLLMLDEPMAGLNSGESQHLSQLIRRLRKDGTTFVFVEHDMDTVMGLADRIVVLDYGRKLAEGTPREIQNDPRVIAAYLGVEEEAV